MLVTSRAYDEYVAMFALDDHDLAGSVLDCSAGAAEFAAIAAAKRCRVVAVDPAYAMQRTALVEQAKADMERGSHIAHEHPDRFTWRWYESPDRRAMLRQRALARVATDLVVSPARYVAGQLPQLPFRTAAFDLALCSHLLFTWGDELGQAWHVAAVTELARVAREVRIFPTVLQGAGDAVPFWDDMITELAEAGLRTELRKVGYEFQIGADQMLLVSAP